MGGLSKVTKAKRTFVTLLLKLARKYNVMMQPVTRNSPETDVIATFRKVARRSHPDKGGSTEDQQRLNAAKEVWDKLGVWPSCAV